ncbi:MAG: DNA repair protein RecN [Oscillospiraceae bacterium]|nr:DNA repair protein RecN [Oscillospiraceae bacterium]
MLRELSIENFAVIERASIAFDDNFNVFTGETGAGKSILIGGINAIAGRRVYKDIVRFGCERAVITALFCDLPDKCVEKLIENGYGDVGDNELLIMRSVNADGKSTVRINSKPASVAVLKEITADLLDIHGQQDSRILTNSEKQRELLDDFADIEPTLSEYKACFREFSSVSRKLRQTQAGDSHKELVKLSLENKINEIEALDLKPGDDTETARRLAVARADAKMNVALDFVYSALSGTLSDNNQTNGALDLIGMSIQELSGVAEHIPTILARLEAINTELADIKSEVLKLLPDSIDENDVTLLEQKMSSIASLKRKYRKELDEILCDCENYKKELAELSCLDELLTTLNERKKNLGEQLKALGHSLTKKRLDAAKILTARITSELAYLDMPDVNLEFRVSPDKVTINGMDNVEIYISVNKGESLKPMSKIASGGELSRIMLAIKSCLAQSDDIPVMIFDEIDTGISGIAANKVGIKLSSLSQKRQIICVTHLAQIAAKATNHLLIEKQSVGERTFTNVKCLSPNERKSEIARIISGDPDSQSALNTANELLGQLTIDN